MAKDDIRCPICNLNLQVLTERKREEHCDACLDTSSFHEPKADASELSISASETASTSKIEISPIPSEPAHESTEDDSIAEIEVVKVESQPMFRSTEPSEGATSMTQVLGKRTRTAGSQQSVSSPKVQRALKPRDKPIPFYKTLAFGAKKIAVDAFNYGPIPNVTSYFLSHFHSDHYGGLSKSWSHGLIYCSSATARLAVLKLKVNPELLRPLELHKSYDIEGIDVMLFDANHCPGAVVFLFNKHTLHTGDFRATKQLVDELRLATSFLHTVYLDTTYLDPNRKFPSQDLVVKVCADYCAHFQSKSMQQSFFTRTPARRRVLVMVGTYTIGKERLALAISRRLNGKIWAESWKQKILEAIGDPTLNEPLCNDGTEAQVHLTSMGELSLQKLDQKWKFLKKHFTHLIAFIPTGWTWPAKGSGFDMTTLQNPKTTSVAHNGLIRICRVPYSEHSSYEELEYFCRSVACRNLTATVHTKRYDILRNWEVRT